ncbi:hypothetical protein N9L92_00215 [Saprospiraceae bacterium]|nr:hypothetical protein [Saprospiraceae bacterium]
MNTMIRIALLVISILLFLSCDDSPKQNLSKLSTQEVIEKFRNNEIDQFKLEYKDSLGNKLSQELKDKRNQGLMIRNYYQNSNNEVEEVWLTDYSDDQVFSEIQFRELQQDPLSEFQFITVNCEKVDSILRDVFKKDQEVRKGNGGNIIETDATNQQIVISIIEKCKWPDDPELINSIWFVIQHSDSKFMALYYPKFMEFVDNGLLKKSTMALMKDRMLMDNGYPQIYGSQIVGKDVYKLRNAKMVNQWRKEVGLGTIEDNARRFGFEFNIEDYIENY